MELSLESIPAISMAMAQNEVLTKVGTSMLNNSIEIVSDGMANLTKAMELSVNPNLGANIDVLV